MTQAPAPPPALPAHPPGVPRVAARAVIVDRGRLLLVNAWPGAGSDLWCAPGGGVEAGQSLPDTLRREVAEETGLAVTVGRPCLVNEFHDPATGFHQVEVFFRCRLRPPGPAAPQAGPPADPAGIVTRRRWVTRDQMAGLRVKPDGLAAAAWGRGCRYDPLEVIVR
jgi:ADP-ribose pyrophosphatase YjhB (NUDIX family)